MRQQEKESSSLLSVEIASPDPSIDDTFSRLTAEGAIEYKLTVALFEQTAIKSGERINLL